ncbi:MAG: glycine cleavage system aminomethyltransferase GcvT [Saprospiraceae bacterium]|nr:glycine cleavage system aminomethyltransferase GcvT [Saprospiraceae bacterium]
MKTTPLTEIHIALGARMAPFAGYNMPISYKGIKDEHAAVRQSVGLFDVSHMGEFIVRGAKATDLVQNITSNDVTKLEIGDAHYSCMPNTTGGIVDDLLVYRLPEDYCSDGEQAYMLVVNASNMEKDWNWIEHHNAEYDCQLINISERTGLLAVQGRNAIHTLQKLTNIELNTIPYYTFKKGTLAGIDNVLISATGYTGSGGFEVYANNLDLADLWNAIIKAGAEYDIQPCGLGARDTLRLEMGYCLYGNDIDDNTSPIEAGLGWITKADKGKFMSSEIFAKQRREGVNRKLIAFELDDRRVPRHGYVIQNEQGEEIGVVTSGTQSPTLDKPIGMGYVKTPYSKIGTIIQIVTGAKTMPAKVVKLPFYKV